MNREELIKIAGSEAAIKTVQGIMLKYMDAQTMNKIFLKEEKEILKSMAPLIKAGYIIEAKTKTGYAVNYDMEYDGIAESWNMSADDLKTLGENRSKLFEGSGLISYLERVEEMGTRCV